jgi:hypothetical protein
MPGTALETCDPYSDYARRDQAREGVRQWTRADLADGSPLPGAIKRIAAAIASLGCWPGHEPYDTMAARLAPPI